MGNSLLYRSSGIIGKGEEFFVQMCKECTAVTIQAVMKTIQGYAQTIAMV